MTKGIKRNCDFCGKEYIPGSNNSRYCSRKCNNKACNKRRTKRYQTDREYREYILKQLSNRFKKRYHNEPSFKERRITSIKKYRKTKKGREFTNANARKTYHNHPEYNERNKKRNNEKYHNDFEWRKRVNQRNRDYLKTEKGKLADMRHSARRRGFGDVVLMPDVWFGICESTGHHLLNDIENPVSDRMFVWYMPYVTHSFVGGHASGFGHWRFNALWIRKLFGIDVKELLSGRFFDGV